MYNKIFFEKFLQKFVVHIFTILLAPFASKLVTYSRHSQSSNVRKNKGLESDPSKLPPAQKMPISLFYTISNFPKMTVKTVSSTRKWSLKFTILVPYSEIDEIFSR